MYYCHGQAWKIFHSKKSRSSATFKLFRYFSAAVPPRWNRSKDIAIHSGQFHIKLFNAPRLLGFLWTITDGKVDIWTLWFLEHWIDLRLNSHETTRSQTTGTSSRGSTMRQLSSSTGNRKIKVDRNFFFKLDYF